MIRKALFSISFLVAMMVIAGCGGGGGGSGASKLPNGVNLVAIEVTPSLPSIALGTNLQLTATGFYADNTKRDITSEVLWKSSSEAVATFSNPDSPGLITAVSTGSATVTATVGTVSAEVPLQVTSVTLLSIQVAPADPTGTVGITQQFTASGILSDYTVQDLTRGVTWTSSDPTVAEVSSVYGSEGAATPRATGSAVITATLGDKSGSSTFTITPATLVSLEISPMTPTVAAGTQQQFTVTGTFSDNAVRDLTSAVTWSSSRTSVATINSTGLALGTNSGTTTITARLGNVSDSTGFTVSNAQLDSIDVTMDYPTVPVVSRSR